MVTRHTVRIDLRGLSRVAAQKPRRCEVAPGEPLQCFVHNDRRLHHRPADSFDCELNVWSIQRDEQVSHALALEASGLVSSQASSRKRALCHKRGIVPKSCLPLAFQCSKPLSPREHMVQDILFTRLWCATSPKYPRSFMTDLLLTSVPRSRRSAQSTTTVVSYPASRVPNQHLLSRKHCDGQAKFLRSFDVHVVSEHFAVSHALARHPSIVL